MPKATVLFDLYSWTDESGASRSAPKGETIDVSSEEVERGVALGGLEAASKSAKAEEPEAARAAGAAKPEPVTASEPEPLKSAVKEPEPAPRQSSQSSQSSRKRKS